MCVQWRKRNQGRFVSTLINPFPVRFVSSHSALDRVFTAHIPNKAFSFCLVGKHRFIVCVCYHCTMSPSTWGQPLESNPLSKSVLGLIFMSSLDEKLMLSSSSYVKAKKQEGQCKVGMDTQRESTRQLDLLHVDRATCFLCIRLVLH